MLVLSRQRDESIILQDAETGAFLARVTIAYLRGDKIGVGLEGPPNVTFEREEVLREALVRGVTTAWIRQERHHERAVTDGRRVSGGRGAGNRFARGNGGPRR